MSQMLLSINPEHVDNILMGIKLYEFRKVKCRSNVDKIVIYATAPVMKVVAEADISYIIEDTPECVWEKTHDFAGITKEYFLQYFEGKKKAVAYRLERIVEFSEPKTLADFGLKYAPQSFVYL